LKCWRRPAYAVAAPVVGLAAAFAAERLGVGDVVRVWLCRVQQWSPADKVSRVSAWDWMGSMAGMPLGFGIAGVLVESIGRTATLASMAVGTFLVCVVFMLDRDVRALGIELVPGGESDETMRDSVDSTG
jgi:hypothetical protein